MPLNCGFGEDSWESLGLQGDPPVHPKGNQSWIFVGRTEAEAETLNTLATWCEELTHWKRLWCWERLKAGGEGDDRAWGVWMASLTWCTWVWASSGSWWWRGKPCVLQSMGLQRVGHHWVTELNWSQHFQWWQRNEHSPFILCTWWEGGTESDQTLWNLEVRKERLGKSS